MAFTISGQSVRRIGFGHGVLSSATWDPTLPQRRALTSLFLSASDEKTDSSESREDRYSKAMEEAKGMKVGDLKKELQDRGIATGSFIEKSEFIKAYAEAIADNVPKGASSASSSSKSKSSTGKKPVEEEPMDPSYRDVVTQKFDRRRLMGQSVIDISIR